MAEQTAQRSFKTVDIIDFAMQSKPTKVNDAFDQIITSKVVDGLETKNEKFLPECFQTKKKFQSKNQQQRFQ